MCLVALTSLACPGTNAQNGIIVRKSSGVAVAEFQAVIVTVRVGREICEGHAFGVLARRPHRSCGRCSGHSELSVFEQAASVTASNIEGVAIHRDRGVAVSFWPKIRAHCLVQVPNTA
jgi:hypothetical protein